MTEEQERAVQATGGGLLVAAAAGSGKTSVLTARVLRHLLLDGIPLQRLLVLTFTERAAVEMRTRIQRELLARQGGGVEGQRAADALAALSDAGIGTIHAFCLRFLREHWQEAGLAPDLVVADERRGALLRQRALAFALEETYREDPAREDLLLAFAELGGDRALGRLVEAFGVFLESIPDPDGFLAGDGAPAEALLPALAEGMRRDLWQAWRDLETAVRIAEAGSPELARALADDVDALRALASAPARAILPGLRSFRFTRLSRLPTGTPGRESALKLRERAKRRLEGPQAFLTAFSDEELLAWDAEEEGLRRALVRAVKRYRHHYRALKEQVGVLDFADLEAHTYALLGGARGPSRLAEELWRQVDEVLVDESQDLNPLQEAIVTRLARPGEENLFLVGDVKQSIYGFRRAAPELFLARFARYGEGGAGPRRLRLSRNFRSTPVLLAAVNAVFSTVLREPARLRYGPDEELRPGRSEDTSAPGDGRVEILLLDQDVRDDEVPVQRRIRREARAVARHLKALVADGTPIWDAEAGAFRSLAYGDVALLFRRLRHHLTAALEVLLEEGVPAVAEGERSFASAPEVDTVLALLRLAGGAEDERTVATWLRAPWEGYGAADLACLWYEGEGSLLAGLKRRAEHEARAAASLARLAEWRRRAERMPAYRFLAELWREEALDLWLASLPGGRRRLANLERLWSLASSTEARGMGVLSFARLVQDLRDVGAEEPAVPLGSAGDAVQVLTVHRAKGLEWPLVYVLGLGEPLTRAREEVPAAFHPELGIGLTVRREDGRRRRGLRHHAVAAAEERQTLEEAARLLYVAMTRARDRLVLVGSAARLAECERAWRLGPEPHLFTGDTYLDWIMPVALAAPACFRIGRIPAGAVAETMGEPPQLEAALLRVKGLHEVPRPLPRPRRLQPSAERPPVFLEGGRAGGRRVGALTHSFLALLPLTGRLDEVGLAEALRRLIAEGRLPPLAGRVIDLPALADFFRTPLASRILTEPERVRREVPFKALVGEGQADAVLVDGVVDLLFWPREGVPLLLDFKTDRVRPEDLERLAAQYRPQLEAYRQGLARITGRVPEAYLVFLSHRRVLALYPRGSPSTAMWSAPPRT